MYLTPVEVSGYNLLIILVILKAKTILFKCYSYSLCYFNIYHVFYCQLYTINTDDTGSVSCLLDKIRYSS